jgi:hypothetical protein
MKPTRLTYLAKWKAQFELVFQKGFDDLSPLSLERLDKIHMRLIKGASLNSNQARFLASLAKRLEGKT